MARRRKRTRWTAEQAQGVLGEWRKSGLALRAFARKRGIRYERLRRWRARLEDRAETGRPRFAPVELDATGSGAGWGQEQHRLEIELSRGVRVIAPAGADPDALARLVRALERRPC